MTGPEPAVRIINLTLHPVTIDIQDAAETAGPAARRVTVPPGGQPARVTEPLVDQRPLRTEHGVVRQARLRRSRRVSGLPPARPGVVYLVPRLTALAARGRGDLVFPFDERRDEDQAVVGVRGVARFRPWWTEPVRSWTARFVSRVLGHALWPDWTIGVTFAVTTALLGAALGVIPGVFADGWTAPNVSATALLGGLGIVALLAGVWLWRRRNRLRGERGTAYVIDEIADAWTYEEKRSFLTTMRAQFAATLMVPGPAALGDDWRWPVGPGAERWDEKVDDLVRGFWAVHFNDDHVTANAVYAWAAWPVAVAFAARAVAGRRGLVLQVRQRPSFGRMGVRDAIDWHQPAHTFERQPAGPGTGPGLEVRQREWPVRLLPCPAESPAPGPRANLSATHILLVRMTTGRWGSPGPDRSPGEPADIEVCDAAGVGLTGPTPATVHEWVCLPPEGGRHPWRQFPHLVQAAVDWVATMIWQHPAETQWLLGMLVPQEVALGIGIHAARSAPSAWPTHLRPLWWAGGDGKGRFVIPGLDLGWAALHPANRR